jgi:carbonic anhydrase
MTDPTEKATMTRMTPLLARNEAFAAGYLPTTLGLPVTGMIIVTCLDHRVDPAITLGLRLGDAPVIRNAGGRVTQAVLEDIAFLACIAEQFGAAEAPDGAVVEVAVIHHTQCGTGFFADPGFRGRYAETTGLAEEALVAAAVTDPQRTVRADVERLLAAPLVSARVAVSGHVYDIATGRVSTVVDAAHPSTARR